MFHEVLVLDLPPQVSPDLCVVVEFYHLIAQQTLRSWKSPIGSCILSLLKNGQPIADGDHRRCIRYGEELSMPHEHEKPDPGNMMLMRIGIRSSLVLPRESLGRFFTELNPDLLGETDPDLALKHFFRILDCLVTLVTTNAQKAIAGMAILSQRVLPRMQGSLLDFFAGFAETFALSRPAGPEFHRRLMDGWAKFMQQDKSNPRQDLCVVDFLFLLIVKSLVLTKDKEFLTEFRNLVEMFSIKSSGNAYDPSSEAFARFIVVIFDLGYYIHAVYAISVQASKYLVARNKAVENFLFQACRPRLFYSAMTKIVAMKNLFFRLICYGRSDYPAIFEVLMKILNRIPAAPLKVIVNNCYELLNLLSPLAALPAMRSNHPAIVIFCLWLGLMSPGHKTIDWWMAGAHKELIFMSVNSALNLLSVSPEKKELVYACHHSIFNFLRVVYGDLTVLGEVTSVLYHFLWIDICVDEYLPIVDILTEILTHDLLRFLEHSDPVLPKFLLRVFKSNSRCFDRLFLALFHSEAATFQTTERSVAFCSRAIAMLNSEELQLLQPLPDDELLRPISVMIHQLKQIDDELTQNTVYEEQLLLIIRRITVLKPSPDALVDELNKLIDFHRKTEHFEEELQAQFLVLAIIAEHLTVQNRIPQLWGTRHPARLFSGLCDMSETIALYPQDECPFVPGYCDSDSFSLRSFIATVEKILLMCAEKHNGCEQVLRFIDLMWPVYEKVNLWGLLGRLFKFVKMASEQIADFPADQDRLFGRYFRVTFCGQAFGAKNRRTFIYREKGLAHLYEMSERLKQQYTELFKHPVELIKESGESKVDPAMTALQVTFVEPYLNKKALRVRKTPFDVYHQISIFYFDTPFTKGEKVHGALAEQWLRRTLLKVEHVMPSITKLAAVTDIQVREFQPIRVAFRQLRDRVIAMDTAIVMSDYRTIQQLLHGSLLVQVNEGPSKMAEVFLSNLGTDPKYERKLANQFREFLAVNKKALAMHGEWTQTNPAFRVLQDTLESGFASLEEALGCYVERML
jgi:hypothetical protein